MTACGDTDNNSTRVSNDVRPVAPITAAQQNNNTGTGLPTDPTRSGVQAGGATATAAAPTATAKSGDTSSGNTAGGGGQGGANNNGQPNPSTTQAAGGTQSSGGGGGVNGNPQAGLAVFKSANCGGCHSNLGKAAGVGPKLTGTNKDDAYIKNIIRNGKSPMPAHSTDEVSDQQITDITAYIRSLK